MVSDTQTPEASQKPRRGWRVGLLVGVALASAAAGGGGVYLLTHRGGSQAAHVHGPEEGGAQAEAAQQYTCPMHPTIVQDHPGTCPICGMNLVPLEKPGGSVARASTKGERKVAFYRSPHDPKKTSPVPMKDEMGMDYVPVYEDEAGGDATVQGLATVDIDPARQQLIGLRTAEVTRGTVAGKWRTTGRVAIDETRIRHVNVKISGFVERIYVDFVGKPVRKGEPLFALYSPELLVAQEEYLLALRTQKTLAQGGALNSHGEDLVASARRKLQLWDVPASEIARLERTGEALKNLPFYSPISGVVTKKDVVQGMRVNAGDMPYEIVDLSEVWVLADVYESELRHVKRGMPATLTLKAFPNRPFQGRVVFIDPLLDPKTRTAKVRLTFPNPEGDLRPEMFGEVVLQGSAREGLHIPADAVVDSGTRSVVFVALGEGKFEPREVKPGDSNGDRVEIVSGLKEGEKVVTRANFLIDSESRLRASLAAMSSGGADVGKGSGGGAAGGGHEGH